MINTQSFVEIVEEMIKEKVEAPFSLGKVNPNYRGGNPQILFDGEASISIKKYPHLSSYKPVSSDRVLLINIAGTHLVIGHIGSFRETTSSGGDAVGLEYTWDGTKLGVKREDETTYSYVDLQGIQGDEGIGLQYDWNGTQLGIKRKDETTYVYQDLESGLRNRETGWVSPALSSSWVSYGVPYQSIQYKRDISNFVTLRGLMKGGTTGILFMLPVGMRPPAQEIFLAGEDLTDNDNITWQDNLGQNMTRINIWENGEVEVFSLGSNSWVTLSGIRFSVD